MRKGNFLQVYLLNLLDIYAQLYASCIFLDINLICQSIFKMFVAHFRTKSV